jgi:hypothetical protein
VSNFLYLYYTKKRTFRKNLYLNIRKFITIIAFLCLCLTSKAQTSRTFYNTGNSSTTKKYVGASWLQGTIVLADGSELNGEVRGFSYKGNDINSFSYRLKKGEKARTIKADACKLISYDGLIVLSLPKNFKKKEGKRQFYVALLLWRTPNYISKPKSRSFKKWLCICFRK